ncbi:unnamed protein product [Brassicogethes aeneus]|uniref:Uncharacterized protein n=1 Tax=Brassicogethes aeneus TaxID=1431903 RepID=A0A9P0B725_BRAAE|nr:unnamed protein product [Brassicogethes aeneus]
MKVISSVLVAALIFGVASCNSLERERDVHLTGIFDKIINSTLNKIIEKLPELITMKDLDINFPESGLIVGSANISSLSLVGINKLVASYIKVNVLNMHLNMTMDLPMVNINMNYGADVTLADLLPLYGDGKININLEKTSLQIAGGVNMTGGISLKDISVILSMGGATFDLHGLIYNEDFSDVVSGMLTDNVAPFINNNQKVISGILSPLIETVFNSVLKPNKELFLKSVQENL